MVVIGDEELFAGCEWLPSRATRADLAAKFDAVGLAIVASAVTVQHGSLSLAPLFALEVALTLVQAQAGPREEPDVPALRLDVEEVRRVVEKLLPGDVAAG